MRGRVEVKKNKTPVNLVNKGRVGEHYESESEETIGRESKKGRELKKKEGPRVEEVKWRNG